ncbi:MAG: M48 family metalloprotease [Candidatus Eremiobacteraeota bacterium]|nr:M48 family metalloprotease [Candidatus Eremiobacteraeota bacterium]
MIRRLVNAGLVVSMLCTLIPAPASAVSTQAEIEQAKAEDKQVLEQYNIVRDPLLNQWVNEIGQRLWNQTARHDIPYNIKILDAQDVNAFTVGGGYIYLNEGALDFVQSDDELSGVNGHETGHNERRHTLTMPAKAQILNLLFGIASIFSPFVYRFGQMFEAGLLAKQSRADELQADQYGLLLMTRAGYDPDAMVSFMKHMGAAHDERPSLMDKYFQDHPGFPDRVSHLVGYEQLDPKKRTTEQLVVQATHDLETSRYNYAALKFQQILKTDQSNSVALLHLGQSQIALGQTEKGQQTLAEAAEKGTPETRTVALSNIKALRDSQAKFSLARPNLAPLRAQMDDAKAREAQAVATIAARRDAGRDQIKSLKARVQSISYGVPDFSRIQVRHGSRLEAILRNLNAMGRSIDAAFGKSSETIGGVGSMEKNKEGGLVKENADIFKELMAPLETEPVPAQSLSTLPYYPRMLADLQLTDSDSIRALDASRSSLALLDVSLGDLDEFIKRLSRSNLDLNGDIPVMDYNALQPLIQRAADSLARAAIAGAQAQQLYNQARARQLQTRITMLGIGYPEDRFATLQQALQMRVKNNGLDFTTMTHSDLTPGEVAAAAIVAADTNTTPLAIVQEAKATNRRIVDVANARGMHAEALEIFLGLVYLDYTDDPVKEARGH